MIPTTPATPDIARPASPMDAQINLMRTLYTVAITSPDQLSAALSQIVEAIAAVFAVEYVVIHLHDVPNQISTIAAEYPSRGFTERVLRFAETPVQAYFASHPESAPLIIDDVTQPDEMMKPLIGTFEEAGVKSSVLAPLRVKETLIGSLNLMMLSTARPFPPQFIPLAQMVANLLAVSIQNVQLNATMHRQIDQVEQIAALGRRIMVTQDQNTIIRETALLTRTFIPVNGISVALHWLGEPTLRLYLVEGTQVLPPITLPYEQAWLRYAYESGVPLVLDRMTGGTQPDYVALAQHALPESWGEQDLLRAALIIPLVVGGQTIGTFNLTRQQANSFTPADLTVANQIAIQLAVALENVRLFSQTANQLRSERLRAQLGGRGGQLAAERVDDILLATLQQVGSALGAQRARVRLSPNVVVPDRVAANHTDADPTLKRIN